jgi:hypothetical protein
MTEEAGWVASADPTVMLRSAQCRAGERRLRLFACGVARTLWHAHPTFLQFSSAVGVTERFADGEIPDSGRADSQRELYRWFLDLSPAEKRSPLFGKFVHFHAALATTFRLHTLGKLCNTSAWEAVSRSGGARLAPVVRCVFGNPFRPVSLDPAWLTSTVTALASQMYDSRDFSPMPILADALQDAGCTSDDILDHCRGDGPHVRGCWVVDLVLGKG